MHTTISSEIKSDDQKFYDKFNYSGGCVGIYCFPVQYIDYDETGNLRTYNSTVTKIDSFLPLIAKTFTRLFTDSKLSKLELESDFLFLRFFFSSLIKKKFWKEESEIRYCVIINEHGKLSYAENTKKIVLSHKFNHSTEPAFYNRYYSQREIIDRNRLFIRGIRLGPACNKQEIFKTEIMIEQFLGKCAGFVELSSGKYRKE